MVRERQYDRVAVRARYRCEYCKAPEWIVNHRFEVDHVIPRRFGGASVFGNLALACRACNRAKSDQLGLLDPELGYPIWLFHPRVDGWDSHFVIDLVAGLIEGKTEKGILTVEVLRMNVLRALVARQQWILYGLLP